MGSKPPNTLKETTVYTQHFFMTRKEGANYTLAQTSKD
jgi:hypothetical protein